MITSQSPMHRLRCGVERMQQEAMGQSSVAIIATRCDVLGFMDTILNTCTCKNIHMYKCTCALLLHTYTTTATRALRIIVLFYDACPSDNASRVFSNAHAHARTRNGDFCSCTCFNHTCNSSSISISSNSTTSITSTSQ